MIISALSVGIEINCCELLWQVDVFTLGRAYLKLAQELYINLPAVGKKALNLYSNIYQYYLWG